MPSILIETGFLTNPTEEKFLNDSINQLKMSTGMFVAFESYRNELEGIVAQSTLPSKPETKVTKDPFVQEEKQELIKEVKSEPKKEIVKVEVKTEPKKEVVKTDVKTEVKPEPKKEIKQEVKIEKSIENNEEKDKVIFRVQIETSDKKIEQTNAKFKGLEVFEYQQDKLFKYTVGKYLNDYKGANILKNNVRSKGFTNAFVVAFLNGERINLEKAIKLAEK